LIYKSLIQYINQKFVMIVCLFWACYYNSYELIPLILSEIFTVFLISVLIFSLTRTYYSNKTKEVKYYLFFSGFTLGFIALTKFIFGYVLLFMLFGSIILWFSNRQSKNHRKGMIILLVAFTINLPYLYYSYNITKSFKWGAITGDNMYWMSTPYSGEYGDWYSFSSINKKSD
jgi:4-amino-4-deoxy-L-arabinose transferase-like glycosyltransferase